METSIVSLIEQLSERISTLETLVNDTIIGGWKKAEEEYRDNEAFELFSNKYGSTLEGLKPDFAVLYGDDFDLPREMYNQLKQAEGYGTDGFDEEGLVNDKILELQEKFGKLKTPNEPVKEEIKVDETEIPSVDELKELYHKGE